MKMRPHLAVSAGMIFPFIIFSIIGVRVVVCDKSIGSLGQLGQLLKEKAEREARMEQEESVARAETQEEEWEENNTDDVHVGSLRDLGNLLKTRTQKIDFDRRDLHELGSVLQDLQQNDGDEEAEENEEDGWIPESPPFEFDPEGSIEDYLNDEYKKAEVQQLISEQLKAGYLVVLNDAFQPDFAEKVHHELWYNTEYSLHTAHFEDGFSCRHHNVYHEEDRTEFMDSLVQLFASQKTKEFAHELTGRDTFGFEPGAPSWYKPGDYSMPHSDYFNQRTVAYVWHLTKDWEPQWGGGMYWIGLGEDPGNAYTPPSFNTLFLFSVAYDTQHFVTHVSPESEGQARRLAFNGWWTSSWEPWNPEEGWIDAALKNYLSVKDHRENLTEAQNNMLVDLLEYLVETPDATFGEAAERESLIDILALLVQENERDAIYTSYFDAYPSEEEVPPPLVWIEEHTDPKATHPDDEL